jgi:hypothetical protein
VVVAILAALVGVAGPVWLRMTVAALIVAVIALGELGLLRLRLPQNARQVPQWIVADNQYTAALQFGFEMGTGVRTFMTSGLPHALTVAVLLAGGPLVAPLAGIAFGAGRACMVLTRYYSADARTWDIQFRRAYRPIKLTVLAAFLAAFALVASAVWQGIA